MRGGSVYEGVVMPTTTSSIVIKLDNGYNVGFCPEKVEIEVLGRVEFAGESVGAAPVQDERLPLVSILSTGGTIASRVDYRTGAVTSQFTAEDILRAIPELSQIARYNAQVVYTILSENMRPDYWIELARAVHSEIKKGAEGVIITHGTDTMTYTAAALCFMLQTPVPVVLVGSQRSADRPSSDNAINALCAAKVATSDIAEVTVVMHATTSDDGCYIHRGCKVRKMHTSRRDAFQSVNALPIGRVDYPDLNITTFTGYVGRGERELELRDRLEQRVALVKYVPGASPELIEHCVEAGYRGIVVEGSGLGHVSTEWIPVIKRAVEEGVPVVVASQCLYGRVCDRVYDTGRDMLSAGIIEAGDMLPEVAFVKLMWVLGQRREFEEVRELMSLSIAGEITGSTPVGSFQSCSLP
jgi:glutamyl-tRNA(Gln) amidotransferase subunit D